MPQHTNVLYTAPQSSLRSLEMAEEPGNGRLKLGWTANNSEVDWSAALVDNERLQRRRRCCMCCILWIFNFLVIVVTAVLLWEILSAKQHFLVFGIGREQIDSTSSTTENPVTSTQRVTSTRERHKATSWKRTSTTTRLTTNKVFVPYTEPDSYGTHSNISDIHSLEQDYYEDTLAMDPALLSPQTGAARRQARDVADVSAVKNELRSSNVTKFGSGILRQVSRLLARLLPQRASDRWRSRLGVHPGQKRQQTALMVGAVEENTLVKNRTAAQNEVVVVIRKKSQIDLGPSTPGLSRAGDLKYGPGNKFPGVSMPKLAWGQNASALFGGITMAPLVMLTRTRMVHAPKTAISTLARRQTDQEQSETTKKNRIAFTMRPFASPKAPSRLPVPASKEPMASPALATNMAGIGLSSPESSSNNKTAVANITTTTIITSSTPRTITTKTRITVKFTKKTSEEEKVTTGMEATTPTASATRIIKTTRPLKDKQSTRRTREAMNDQTTISTTTATTNMVINDQATTKTTTASTNMVINDQATTNTTTATTSMAMIDQATTKTTSSSTNMAMIDQVTTNTTTASTDMAMNDRMTTKATTPTTKSTITEKVPLKPCLRRWIPWGDSCYRRFPYQVSWNQANRLCLHYHSHLASVHSNTESMFLIGRFGPICHKSQCKVITGIHIGLTDKAHEGQFVWTDGTPLNLVKWSLGEPTNSVLYGGPDGEDCAELRVVFGFGEWNDIDCERVKRPFVCKAPAYAHTSRS